MMLWGEEVRTVVQRPPELPRGECKLLPPPAPPPSLQNPYCPFKTVYTFELTVIQEPVGSVCKCCWVGCVFFSPLVTWGLSRIHSGQHLPSIVGFRGFRCLLRVSLWLLT